MSQIEQEFLIRNKEDSPLYYLGNSIKQIPEKLLHVSSKKYVNEVLHQYQQKIGNIHKENIPISPNVHPELDDKEFCNEILHKQYQHIIGVCQWILTSGRIDISYALCSLSRFSVAPCLRYLVLKSSGSD